MTTNGVNSLQQYVIKKSKILLLFFLLTAYSVAGKL